MRFTSLAFLSVLVGTFSALCRSVRITSILCCRGSFLSNSRQWSVCVAFLKTFVSSHLFSIITTLQSKKCQLIVLHIFAGKANSRVHCVDRLCVSNHSLPKKLGLIRTLLRDEQALTSSDGNAKEVKHIQSVLLYRECWPELFIVADEALVG